jgi:hypothetical protein
MQKHYSKKDGFKNWYDVQQKKMTNDSDLGFLTKARNESIHKELIKTIMEFTLIPTPSGTIVKNPYENAIFTVDKRAFEKGEMDIIKFSETQLNKLIQLVNECERLFL